MQSQWNRTRCGQPLLGLLLTHVLFCLNAFCWETLPEFQSLSESEATSFEGPGLLNAEYTSDLLAYSKPSSWEYFWLTHPKVLEISFGSLNTTRFAMENRLKIQQPLTDFFEFRFTYLNEANLERQSHHTILELIFWFWSKLGLVFYGEPDFRKPKDDTGVALLFRPSQQHEIRFFNTFVDVTRLKYPDSPDTFIEPYLPSSRGIVGRAWSQPKFDTELGHFIEYAVRYDTPTSWKFFEKNNVYHSWKWFASLYGRYQFSKLTATALRFQFDRKYESKVPFASPSAETGTWYTSRLTLLSEETLFNFIPEMNWDFTFGMKYVLRQWNADQFSGSYNDLLPYFRLSILAWGSSPNPSYEKDHWVIGYILTWHHEKGDPAIGIQPHHNRTVEHRLNLSYEFSFGRRGKLVLLASADLDQLGTRASWGGGCGQFQLAF